MAEITEAKRPGAIRSIAESPAVTKGIKAIFGWKSVKVGYVQDMPSYKKVVVAPPSYEKSGIDPLDSAAMFPNETIIYFDEHRDMVVSTDYDAQLIRPLPIYVIAIRDGVGFTGGDKGENAAIPFTLHRGPDKTGPIYGFVEKIERHATVTLNTHAYDPSAPSATTVFEIGAHLTRNFCDFEFLTGTPESPSTITLQKFVWKECGKDPECVELCATRAVDKHDWSWYGRGERRGKKLFHEKSGDVMAIFVPGKRHSQMNPVRIAAKVRWLESARWTDELKLAAFMALMTYGELSRRVGTGGG